MDLEAEIEALKRQNRRLKVALLSIVILLFVAMVGSAGVVGITATRARAEAVRAMAMEREARANAEAAFAKAQEALQQGASDDAGR